MKTVFVTINTNTEEVKVHRFAETARNTVFEWAKNYLCEENLELPDFAKHTDDEIMEEANEIVIQAEETPWLSGPYTIIETVIED